MGIKIKSSVLINLGKTAGVGGDNRTILGHGLKSGERETLKKTGMDQSGGRGKSGPKLGISQIAGKLDLGLETESADLGLELREKMSFGFADNLELEVG